ncbi:MAG: hypothetical protein ACSLE0_06765 [Chitinophagaceae bacterium]
MKNYITAFLLAMLSIGLKAQSVKLSKSNLVANQVSVSLQKLDGEFVLRVIKDSTVEKVDEPTFVKIKDINFEN